MKDLFLFLGNDHLDCTHLASRNVRRSPLEL